MCEEGHKEIIDRLDQIERKLDKIDFIVRGSSDNGKPGLDTIINGSDELGVEPIRTTVNRVATAHDRVIWLLGILGLVSIPSLIGWILFILGRSTMP